MVYGDLYPREGEVGGRWDEGSKRRDERILIEDGPRQAIGCLIVGRTLSLPRIDMFGKKRTAAAIAPRSGDA